VDQSSEERRIVDLGVSLEDIVTTLGPSLKNTGCHIALKCPQMIIVETAPGALYQIITNLVMNSITHGFASDRNPQVIHGREEAAPGQPGREAGEHEKPNEIRIDVRREAAQIHIDYSDNGSGMEESVRVRIFEPFFTTRRGKGGSGLGMHIVYNLVAQSLRGSIECVSAPGQGVLFRIVMPST